MSNEDLFLGVQNAKSVSKFASRLGVGRHRVALKRFVVKASETEFGRILEADLLVVESTSHDPLETKGWAWFPESKGWAGRYEQDRLKEFLTACGQCVGDNRGIAEIGGGMQSDRQTGRGLLLDVEVSYQFEKDGVTKKINPNGGKPYTDITWRSVPQTLEQVAQYRRELDQLEGKAEVQASVAYSAAPEPVTAAVPAAAATPAQPFSLLGRK